jgi:hypothetical protein
MTEYDELSDELEREADRLESASDSVEGHIQDTREDLHRKQHDLSVPGADHDDHVFAPGGGRDEGKQAEEGDAEDPDALADDESEAEG